MLRMTVSDPESQSTTGALIRGALGQCPRCGRGRLLHRYLKIVDRCSGCGEPYGHFRVDDAAPWLTILLVGHMTMPIVLMSEQSFDPPMWVGLSIYLPFIVLLTLGLLPRCKGMLLAVMWVTKAEGSEKI
jgi:uncharacterized protein (DUF983 family)